MDPMQSGGSTWWRSLAGLAAPGFGAVVAFFLLTEHRAHLFGFLPWLLILACPVMMMFMHHGHKHHEHKGHMPGSSEQAQSPQEKHP
jgi:hypothetical protein